MYLIHFLLYKSQKLKYFNSFLLHPNSRLWSYKFYKKHSKQFISIFKDSPLQDRRNKRTPNLYIPKKWIVVTINSRKREYLARYGTVVSRVSRTRDSVAHSALSESFVCYRVVSSQEQGGNQTGYHIPKIKKLSCLLSSLLFF